MNEAVSDGTFQWLVGGLFGLLTTIFSLWIKALDRRLENLGQDIRALDKETDLLSKELHERTQRIAILETYNKVIYDQLAAIQRKLDLLIEQKTQE